MKDDRLYLIHIAECINRIESYTQGMAKGAFWLHHSCRTLQTLAESTQRLSARAQESQPGIEWYKIAGFRKALVHDYLGVDLEKVWNIVQNDLSALKNAVSEMLGPKSQRRNPKP